MHFTVYYILLQVYIMIRMIFLLEVALLIISILSIGLGSTLVWIFWGVILGILLARYGIKRGNTKYVLAGFLLVIPGYITDFFAMLVVLNIPILSILASMGVLHHINTFGAGAFGNRFQNGFTTDFTQPKTHTPQDSDIIDGDFTRKDD